MDQEEPVTKWKHSEGCEFLTLDAWIRLLVEKEFNHYIDYKIEEPGEIDGESLTQLSISIANHISDLPIMEELKVKILCYIDSTTLNLMKCENEATMSLWDLVELISSHQPMNHRVRGLELLLKIPMSEVTTCGAWLQLQRVLCEGLCEDNRNVFYLILKVHAKLLSSANINSTKEGFISLMEGLALHYLSRRTVATLPVTIHGLQLTTPCHCRMIQIMSTLLRALKEMPKRWIRCGEKYVEEIIDSFVDLFTMHTYNRRTTSKDREILYPFHILSALDPEAKWCYILMHSAFTRNILMKCLAKTSSLVRFLVEEVLRWLECQLKQSDGVTIIYEACAAGNISGNVVALTTFTHCLSIVVMLVGYEQGCSVFPVQTLTQDEPVTVYKIATSILTFLNKNAKSLAHGVQLYSSHVWQMLEKSVAALILCRGGRILSGSSVDLTNLLLERRGPEPPILHQHCISILHLLSDTENAVGWILGRTERRVRASTHRSRSTLSSASSYCRENVLPRTSRPSLLRSSSPLNHSTCIGKAIVECTTLALSRWETLQQLLPEQINYLIKLLSICHKLFSAYDGFGVLEGYHCRLIFQTKALLMNMTHSSIEAYQDKLFTDLKSHIENFFLGVSSSPLGFKVIAAEHDLVKALICSYVDQPWAVWDNPQIKQLLQLSSFMVHQRWFSNQLNKLLTAALKQLWAAYEDELAFLTGSERIWVEAVNLFISRLLTICSSPQVLEALLSEGVHNADDSSDGEGTIVDSAPGPGEPQTLSELFSNLRPDTIGGLVTNPAQAHLCHVGLIAMHALSHDLDISVMFQEKLDIQELEIALCISSDGNDMLRTSRKDISSNSQNQHFLQVRKSQQACSICDFTHTWHQRRPTSPQLQPRTARSRSQTDMQRFLQDTRLGLHDTMWITHARRAYRSSSQCDLKVSVVLDLMEQVQRSQPVISNVNISWPSSANISTTKPRHSNAIQMIVKYGIQQKILSPGSSAQCGEQLAALLDQAHSFLREPDENPEFDWFVAAVFLLCAGNGERTRSLLQKVSQLPTAVMLWPRMHGSSYEQLSAQLGQQLLALIAVHLPQAHQALQEAGLSWWTVTDRLAKQAFLSVLPLPQIMHMLVLSALHPVEYLLYLRVALLSYLQPQILSAAVSGHIITLVNAASFEDFRLCDYLAFMDRLAKWNRQATARDRMSVYTL